LNAGNRKPHQPARNSESGHHRIPGERELRRAKALERAAKEARPDGRAGAVGERTSAGDTPLAPLAMDPPSPETTTAAAGDSRAIQPPSFRRAHSFLRILQAKDRRPRSTEARRRRRRTRATASRPRSPWHFTEDTGGPTPSKKARRRIIGRHGGRSTAGKLSSVTVADDDVMKIF